MFSRYLPPLDYVRSKGLAVYSFFGIPSEEANEVSKALLDFEKNPGGVDDSIDLKMFMEKYCLDNKHVMKVIWLEYFPLLLKKMKPEALEKVRNTEAVPDLLIFTCFLVFFLSIEESLLGDFVYWIYFTQKGIEITKEKMIELASKLGHSKQEKGKKLLQKRVAAIERSTKVSHSKHSNLQYCTSSFCN